MHAARGGDVHLTVDGQVGHALAEGDRRVRAPRRAPGAAAGAAGAQPLRGDAREAPLGRALIERCGIQRPRDRRRGRARVRARPQRADGRDGRGQVGRARRARAAGRRARRRAQRARGQRRGASSRGCSAPTARPSSRPSSSAAGCAATSTSWWCSGRLSREGRSRARVGGELVPVGTLAELLRGRLEISSQHDSQSLLSPERARTPARSLRRLAARCASGSRACTAACASSTPSAPRSPPRPASARSARTTWPSRCARSTRRGSTPASSRRCARCAAARARRAAARRRRRRAGAAGGRSVGGRERARPPTGWPRRRARSRALAPLDAARGCARRAARGRADRAARRRRGARALARRPRRGSRAPGRGRRAPAPGRAARAEVRRARLRRSWPQRERLAAELAGIEGADARLGEMEARAREARGGARRCGTLALAGARAGG